MKPARISRTAWTLCAVALTLSFAAGTLALRPFTSYWLPFWPWAFAVLLLAGWAVHALAQDCGGRRRIAAALRTHRRELLLVFAITALAFFLRTVALSSVPYPFGTDEPTHALAARDLLAGASNRTGIFGYGILNHPALFSALGAQLHRFFDLELAQRLTSALWGTLLIPLLYLLLRALWDKRIALAGAAYAATYHLHVHYSRIAINNVQSATIATLAILCAWLALTRRHPAYFVLAGLSTALAGYSYIGTRLVILVVLSLFALAFFARTFPLRKYAPHAVLFFLAFAVVIMPIALRLPQHPAELLPRSHTLAQFSDAEQPLAQIGSNVAVSFALLAVLPETRATLYHFYNAPIPLVDPLSFVPFIVGLIGALIAFREPRNHLMLLLLLSTTVILGGLLRDPYSGRFLLAVPVICAWVALGTARIVRFLRLPAAAFALCIALLCAANAAFYFGIYAPGDYYAGDTMRAHVQLLDHARTLPNTTEVFLYGWPRISLTNPEVLIALRTYPVFEVRANGSIAMLPATTRSASSPRTFLFFADVRADELGALQKHCPGGTLFPFANAKNQTVAYAYTFLTNSTCKPVVLARNAAVG